MRFKRVRLCNVLRFSSGGLPSNMNTASMLCIWKKDIMEYMFSSSAFSAMNRYMKMLASTTTTLLASASNVMVLIPSEHSFRMN